MGSETNTHQEVRAHYDAVADVYHQHYDENRLRDLSAPYPANYFRLQILVESFERKNIRSVIEIGVGEGTPLVHLAKKGMDVMGLDISEKMVHRCRDNMAQNGLNTDRIGLGNIEDPSSYRTFIGERRFDALIAMGVMPHVEKDDEALRNMAALVRPGGSVFIEFRNKLFSFFTFNRYSYDFIVNDLLKSVSAELKDKVAADLKTRLRLDQPSPRKAVAGSDAPGYDAILSKFHNPFEVLDHFGRLGFRQRKLRWYHYHPAMPYLEKEDRQLFRDEAVRLENIQSDWRSFFLCSAFVVEAVKGDS